MDEGWRHYLPALGPKRFSVNILLAAVSAQCSHWPAPRTLADGREILEFDSDVEVPTGDEDKVDALSAPPRAIDVAGVQVIGDAQV